MHRPQDQNQEAAADSCTAADFLPVELTLMTLTRIAREDAGSGFRDRLYRSRLAQTGRDKNWSADTVTE
jgi:hypothetical protein